MTHADVYFEGSKESNNKELRIGVNFHAGASISEIMDVIAYECERHAIDGLKLVSIYFSEVKTIIEETAK